MGLEDTCHTALGRDEKKILFAPPNTAGFIPDDECKETFKSYLGLPSPVYAPFIGQWIGSEGKQHK
eukprot:3426316-Ditylum_brightwellii.AAC.1